jgi:hypothetical protein
VVVCIRSRTERSVRQARSGKAARPRTYLGVLQVMRSILTTVGHTRSLGLNAYTHFFRGIPFIVLLPDLK